MKTAQNVPFTRLRRVRPAWWLLLLVAAIALVWVLVTWASRNPDSPGQAAGVEQTIENKGSDTLVNLALAWAERYMGLHPNVRISVTGGGSGTGIAAMINGTVDVANASRAMKSEEIAAAVPEDVAVLTE